MVYLNALFTKFCAHFDGKLVWGSPAKEYTDAILDYFTEQSRKEGTTSERNYMLIDQVWRGQHQEIVLAVEHENFDEAARVLEKEIVHLIDLRALNKIVICYPEVGDEQLLIENTSQRIFHRSVNIPILNEKYLIILGFNTKKKGQRAILFKAHVLNYRGEKIGSREQIIFQRNRTKE